MKRQGKTASATGQRRSAATMRGQRAGDGWARRARRRSRSLATGNGGASAVEFAFILPVLLLLLIGIIDVGVLMMTQNHMVRVAQDAARRLSLSQITEQEAQDYVRGKLKGLGGTLKVEALLPNSDAGEVDVTVTIAIPMADVIPIDIGMRGLDAFRRKTLQTQITMQQEVQQ